MDYYTKLSWSVMLSRCWGDWSVCWDFYTSIPSVNFSRVISRVAKLISDLILEMIYQEIFKISKSKVSNIPSLFQVETISSRNFISRSRYHGSLQWSRLNRGGSSDTSFHEDSASVDRRSIPIGNSSRERVDFMAIHCHGSIVSHCLCYSLRC